VPVPARNRQDARRAAYLWAPAADVDRWHAIAGEQDADDEAASDADEPVSFTEQELDSSCRYGDPGRPISGRRPRRDAVYAAGRYLLDNGVKWRALPADFPAWDRVYAFFPALAPPGPDQRIPRPAARPPPPGGEPGDRADRRHRSRG
jgi:hypothetical protein